MSESRGARPTLPSTGAGSHAPKQSPPLVLLGSLKLQNECCYPHKMPHLTEFLVCVYYCLGCEGQWLKLSCARFWDFGKKRPLMDLYAARSDHCNGFILIKWLNRKQCGGRIHYFLCTCSHVKHSRESRFVLQQKTELPGVLLTASIFNIKSKNDWESLSKKQEHYIFDRRHPHSRAWLPLDAWWWQLQGSGWICLVMWLQPLGSLTVHLKLTYTVCTNFR